MSHHGEPGRSSSWCEILVDATRSTSAFSHTTKPPFKVRGLRACATFVLMTWAWSRRSLVVGGGGLLAAVHFGGKAQGQPVAAASTPDAALNLLMEGNARYVANQPRERDFSAGRASRAQGQAPFAAVLGCADSRVAPELAFDQNPGDLFVVRVAGNFVTTDGLGSLEFGAAALGTKLIMVLGHSSCGAVSSTVTALQKGNAFPCGSRAGDEAGHRTHFDTVWGDLEQRAVIANVRYNVERLQQAGPILAEMVTKKEVRVVGAVYDLSTGQVSFV
jgi:carbonic anhydrase